MPMSFSSGSPILRGAAFDPTGTALAHPQSIIYEHDFNGPAARLSREAGFCSLYTPGSANQAGSTQWISRGGLGRLANICGKVAGGSSMSLLRANNMFGDGLFRVEATISIEQMNLGTTYPDRYVIGVDTGIEAATNNRRFFEASFVNWNEAGSNQPLQWNFEFSNGAGTTLTPVPSASSGVASFVANENKALPYYLAMDFSTLDGSYHGFQFGNQFAVGSLDPTGATAAACTALGVVPAQTLPAYRNGANICFGIVNRSASSVTCGQMNLHWVRLTKIG